MDRDAGNEERLELALEAAGLDLWENNLATGEVPRRALKTMAELGYDHEEAAAYVNDIVAIVHPDDVDMLMSAVNEHLQGHTPQYRCEFRLRAKNGAWLWYANYGKIMDRSGDKPGQRLIGVTFNIDDRKKKEQELEETNRKLAEQIAERKQASLLLEEALSELQEANRAKSNFFAAVSHDLRQPIHAMNLLLDVLNTSESKSDRDRVVQSIKAASLSLTDMLESLLDISRLDGGAVVPNPQPVSSDELIAKIDATFSPLALKQKIRFKIWFPHEPLTFFVDRQLLMSVLDNIIGNAFKNTVEGGVLVALRPRGSGFAFQVWDTGTGIAEEHLEHIFEEYFQIDNPSRDRSRGIGLGLAIVRRICNLLGLKLSCRSVVGKGTVFEVMLPAGIAYRGAADEVEIVSHVDMQRFGGCRFVVVEDDALVGEALQEALHYRGLAVVAHRSAEDALADSSVSAHDCFIVDHQLAGVMSGFDFLDAIKARFGTTPKAVVISGNTTDGFIEGAKSRGLAFLFKPAAMDTILETLAELPSVCDLAASPTN
ncbi:MAG TPA: ATP-binding protein [Rhodocyclaceae bacterium]|nr:ATP-binding protein [Rhodocyclaceae bacterium]